LNRFGKNQNLAFPKTPFFLHRLWIRSVPLPHTRLSEGAISQREGY